MIIARLVLLSEAEPPPESDSVRMLPLPDALFLLLVSPEDESTIGSKLLRSGAVTCALSSSSSSSFVPLRGVTAPRIGCGVVTADSIVGVLDGLGAGVVGLAVVLFGAAVVAAGAVVVTDCAGGGGGDFGDGAGVAVAAGGAVVAVGGFVSTLFVGGGGDTGGAGDAVVGTGLGEAGAGVVDPPADGSVGGGGEPVGGCVTGGGLGVGVAVVGTRVGVTVVAA
ncbi:hypothetical protein FI667_g9076, partial [Globisporangium splendens]